MSQSRRLLGVVMDPIETIKPKKDSTLAMLLAAQRRGWDIVYLRQQDLEVRDGAPRGHGSRLTVRDDTERWFEIGTPWIGGLEGLDALLMRKDPPFDMEYIYTTYILELAENRGLLVVNKPASLRDINEKAYTAWFPQCTPPSLVTRSRTALLEFLKEHGKVVLKPFDGMGGQSVFVRHRRRSQHQRDHRDADGRRSAIHAGSALHPRDRQRRQARVADRRRADRLCAWRASQHPAKAAAISSWAPRAKAGRLPNATAGSAARWARC